MTTDSSLRSPFTHKETLQATEIKFLGNRCHSLLLKYDFFCITSCLNSILYVLNIRVKGRDGNCASPSEVFQPLHSSSTVMCWSSRCRLLCLLVCCCFMSSIMNCSGKRRETRLSCQNFSATSQYRNLEEVQMAVLV